MLSSASLSAPFLTLLPDPPLWPAVFVPQTLLQHCSDGVAVPSPTMSQRTIQPSPMVLLSTPRSATAALEGLGRPIVHGWPADCCMLLSCLSVPHAGLHRTGM